MQILLVEDDESIRSSMTYYFKKKTYAFIAVQSAEEALKSLEHFTWDIIISDYQLPGMNGVTFLNIVGQCHPQIMKILITAHANLEVATKAIKAGIHDFIQKPFKTDVIISSLKHLIEKRESSVMAPAINGKKLMEIEKSGWEQNAELLIKTLAHQISDSLQALQGTAELGLLTSEENHEIKSCFSNILDKISTVNILSNELKSFGDWMGDPIQPTDITQVLENCMAVYQSQLGQYGIRFIKNSGQHARQIIQTRTKVLTRIINDILSYAIQWLTGKSGENKSIQIATKEEEDCFFIHISCTGTIMKTKTSPKNLSEGTQRSDDSAAELSFTERLCFGLGAQMDIQDRENGGRVFQIRLAKNSGGNDLSG